jgi:hypothetical protein
MDYSREIRERAFLCARNWAVGERPDGEPGPIKRGMAVAVKVGSNWRQGVAVSQRNVAWVNAADIEPFVLHLFDLGDEVRERLEAEWGISSPPHPPPADSRPPWDVVLVRRASVADHEVLVLPT